MMRTRPAVFGSAVLAGAALLLASCGGEPEEKSSTPQNAARDIAMVERMNKVDAKSILPQGMNADDMARYDLNRGCLFRIEGSDEPVFVAQRERGYLKLDGALQPVSAKAGSAELPGGARSIYVGLDNWVELVAQAGAGGNENTWPSRVVIHDAQERVVYDKAGRVTCSA